MKVGVTALSSMNMVADALLKQKLPGEPVVEVQANGLKMEAQRSNPADLCRVLSQNETTNCICLANLGVLHMWSCRNYHLYEYCYQGYC